MVDGGGGPGGARAAPKVSTRELEETVLSGGCGESEGGRQEQGFDERKN